MNCLKTIPFTAAHTYTIAHIWQYPTALAWAQILHEERVFCRAAPLGTPEPSLLISIWRLLYTFLGALVSTPLTLDLSLKTLSYLVEWSFIFITLSRHDGPQALDTCGTVIWIDRLRNIKQRKCWQPSAGPKIGNYKKSLELITRTLSCVHLANSYDILFRQEQNVLLSPLTITETSVNTSSILL